MVWLDFIKLFSLGVKGAVFTLLDFFLDTLRFGLVGDSTKFKLPGTRLFKSPLIITSLTRELRISRNL